MPGVEAASVAQVVPLALDFDGGRRRMRPSQYAPQPGEDMEVHFNAISPGYLATRGCVSRAAVTSPRQTAQAPSR